MPDHGLQSPVQHVGFQGIGPQDPAFLHAACAQGHFGDLGAGITINRVRVVYTRADGRNTQGVDVPFAFDSAVTGTIQAAGTLTLGFELVRQVAKQESPLVQLRTSSNIISAIATVTFYGVDRVGNNVQATGQLQIEFGNFGDF